MESYINLVGGFTRTEILSLNTLKEYFASHYLEYPFDIFNNEFLIRFLRCNNFNIENTYKQFKDYLQFYKEYDIPNISKVKFPNIDKIKLFYPHGFHKTTKEGYPIFIQNGGDIKIDDIDKGLPDKMGNKYIINIFERLLHEIFPKCSKNKKVDKFYCLVDLKGLTTSGMSKKILNFVYAQLSICENYYPCLLDKLVFVNCGMIFRGGWSVCKYIYKEDTRNKVQGLGFDYTEKLLERINETDLPKLFGGDCNCDPYGCMFSDCGPWNESYGSEKGKGSYEKNKNDQLNLNKLI